MKPNFTKALMALPTLLSHTASALPVCRTFEELSSRDSSRVDCDGNCTRQLVHDVAYSACSAGVEYVMNTYDSLAWCVKGNEAWCKDTVDSYVADIAAQASNSSGITDYDNCDDACQLSGMASASRNGALWAMRWAEETFNTTGKPAKEAVLVLRWTEWMLSQRTPAINVDAIHEAMRNGDGRMLEAQTAHENSTNTSTLAIPTFDSPSKLLAPYTDPSSNHHKHVGALLGIVPAVLGGSNFLTFLLAKARLPPGSGPTYPQWTTHPECGGCEPVEPTTQTPPEGWAPPGSPVPPPSPPTPQEPLPDEPHSEPQPAPVPEPQPESNPPSPPHPPFEPPLPPPPDPIPPPPEPHRDPPESEPHQDPPEPPLPPHPPPAPEPEPQHHHYPLQPEPHHDPPRPPSPFHPPPASEPQPDPHQDPPPLEPQHDPPKPHPYRPSPPPSPPAPEPYQSESSKPKAGDPFRGPHGSRLRFAPRHRAGRFVEDPAQRKRIERYIQQDLNPFDVLDINGQPSEVAWLRWDQVTRMTGDWNSETGNKEFDTELQPTPAAQKPPSVHDTPDSARENFVMPAMPDPTYIPGMGDTGRKLGHNEHDDVN